MLHQALLDDNSMWPFDKYKVIRLHLTMLKAVVASDIDVENEAEVAVAAALTFKVLLLQCASWGLDCAPNTTLEKQFLASVAKTAAILFQAQKNSELD